MSNNNNYEDEIRRALHQAVDPLPVADALDKIRDKIRRHTVNVYVVEITEGAEDNPTTSPSFPITSLTLRVKAIDDEIAEDVADDVIGAIQQRFNVHNALQIDSVYEL